MATVMNPQSHHLAAPRSVPQKVCIGLGIFFILAGLGGIIMPGMLGMHLSLVHNIVHLASGALALWFGYADDPKKAYKFCIAFGAVYGLLGLVGFIFGRPGFPGVGHLESDQNLLRIIPNVFEVGTADHIVHILLSAAFLVSAYMWKKRHDVAGRESYSQTPGAGDVFRKNSQSDLKDASLGRSDINRPIDKSRRSEFESQL